MIKKIDRLMNWIGEGVQFLMAALMLVSVIVIFIQVFCRYVLGFSLAWSEEFARYASIWITFLGVGVVARKRDHIRLDFFEYLLPPKARYVVFLVESGISIFFYALLGYFGYMLLGAASRQVAPGLHISMVYPYLAIPIGSLILVVFVIWLILRTPIGAMKEEEGES